MLARPCLSSASVNAPVTVQALTAKKLTQINGEPAHGAAAAALTRLSVWSAAHLPQRLIPPLALGAFLIAGAAEAQQCYPRSLLVAKLAEKHNETRHAIGLGAKGDSVVELFASPDGTWTILRSAPSGMSCIIAAGDNFATVIERLPPQL